MRFPSFLVIASLTFVIIFLCQFSESKSIKIFNNSNEAERNILVDPRNSDLAEQGHLKRVKRAVS